MAEMVQNSLATLKTPEECQAEQIRAYVDERSEERRVGKEC